MNTSGSGGHAGVRAGLFGIAVCALAFQITPCQGRARIERRVIIQSPVVFSATLLSAAWEMVPVNYRDCQSGEADYVHMRASVDSVVAGDGLTRAAHWATCFRLLHLRVDTVEVPVR